MATPSKPVQLTIYLSDSIRCAETCVSVLVDECSNAQDVVRAAAAKARLVNPHGFELAEVFVSRGHPRKERRLEPTQVPDRVRSLWPQVPPAARPGSHSPLCAQPSLLPEELEAEYRFYLVRRDTYAAAVTGAAVPSSSHEGEGFAGNAHLTPAGGMQVTGSLRTLTWSECPNPGVPMDSFLLAFLNQRWDGVECADLCRLPSLDERSMLENLKQRFGNRNAYTYVGTILVAVNPFQFFPIYNPKYVLMYEGRRLGELPPHIFAVADAAFHTMVNTRQSQCVVISGESGSGKTESTNFLLHHLTHLSHKGTQSMNGVGVEYTLLGAGPVLEAFGNAKTVHNNNSSRFGKFIQVNYRKNGTVNGAVVEKYLLEKSRIVSQAKAERNYHVFYYLLCGAPQEVLQTLSLGKPSDYNYLNQSGCYEVSGTDNQHDYAHLLQSMELVGFSSDTQKKILSVLAAVLHLGNIEFQKKHDYHHDEAVLIGNTEVLSVISRLLCVKEDTLLEALTSRRTVAGGDTVVVNYKKPDAVAQRDAMAKCLYGALFDWIVLQVNHSLLLKQDLPEVLGNSIGVLDIFGFEDFKVNGFEQFCINYANEHLQYYFNQHIFKFEQEEYEKEGITWQNIEFIDNTGCIDLFAKRPKGLFFLLDEEGNFPGATNDTLLEKFNQNHRSSHYYQMPMKKESTFIICHYAGKVKYYVQDFREKNNDHMRADIVSVLKNSSLSFVKELVGSSPIAMLRWAYLRVCIKSLWAFIDAGRRFYKAGGPRIGVRRRQSVQKVGHKSLHSPADPDGYDFGADVLDGVAAAGKNTERPVFRDESDSTTSAGDSYIYTGSHDTKPRRKSSKGKHRSKTRAWKGFKDLQTLQEARETTKSKTPTISLQFQQSLGQLLSTLDKAHPFFVRCIKSNESQTPNLFDEEVVLRQLRYTGMLATIKIRQSGYNYRSDFKDFIRQYRALLPRGASSEKEDIQKFLGDIDCKANFQIGMTKVFLRETLKILLDQALDHALTARIIKIQRWVRSRLSRLRYVRMQTAAMTIQKYWQRWLRRLRARGAEGEVSNDVCPGKTDAEPADIHVAGVRPRPSESSRPVEDLAAGLPTLTGFRKMTMAPAGRLSRDDSQFERDFESLVDQGGAHMEHMNSFSSSEGDDSQLASSAQVEPVAAHDSIAPSAATMDAMPNPAVDDLSPKGPSGAILVTTPSSRQLLPLEVESDVNRPPCPDPSTLLSDGAELATKSPVTRRGSQASIGSSSSSTSGSSSFSEASKSEPNASRQCRVADDSKELPLLPHDVNSVPASPRTSHNRLQPEQPKDEHVKHLQQHGVPEGLEFDRSSIYRRGIKKSHSADSIPPQPASQSQLLPVTSPSEVFPKPEKSPVTAKKSLPPTHRSEENLESTVITGGGSSRKPCAEDSRSLMSVKSATDDWTMQRPRSPSGSSTGKGANILSKLKNKLSGSKSVRNMPEELELEDLKHTAVRLPSDLGQHANVPVRGNAEQPSGAVPLSRSRSSRNKNIGLKDQASSVATPAASATPAVTTPTVTQWSVAGTSQWQYPETWEVKSHSTLSKMIDLIHHKKMEFNKWLSKHQEVPVFDRVFKDALNEFEKSLILRLATSNDDSWRPVKYRDLMDSFSEVLTVSMRNNVKHNDIREFPSILVVNAFRGYLDEFHKQTESEQKRDKKVKKKKEKTKSNQAFAICGHRLYSLTVIIKTFCEVCNKVITFFDKGLECEACKFTCHKTCTSKCTAICTTAQQQEENLDSGFVFGKRLSQLVADEDNPVPFVFEKLLQAVETKGLFTEGIYRKSGLAERVRNLKKVIDTTPNPENIDFHDYAVHVLTSAVKAFLRDLSEPLLTSALYTEFVRAADVEDNAEALHALKATMEKLPRYNYEVLMRLLLHLARVAQNEGTNRMSTNALAIVFSPCLLRMPSSGTLGRGGGAQSGGKRGSVAGSTAVQESLRDVPRQVRSIELLIDWMLRHLNMTFSDLDALERAEQQTNERLNVVRASMRSMGKKRHRNMLLPLSQTTTSESSDKSQVDFPAADLSGASTASTGDPLPGSGLSSPSTTPVEALDLDSADVIVRRLTKDLEDIRQKRSHVTGRLAKIGTITDDDQLSTDDIDTSGDSVDDISLEENGERQRIAASSVTFGQLTPPMTTPVVSLPSLPGAEAAEVSNQPLVRQRALPKRNIFRY